MKKFKKWFTESWEAYQVIRALDDESSIKDFFTILKNSIKNERE
ncbi:hypothetical protein ACWM35_12620 [Neobacillus sp. K501]